MSLEIKKLTQFLSILKKYRENIASENFRLEIQGQFRVIIDYYNIAYAAFLIWKEAEKQWLNASNPDDEKIMSNKRVAMAFGIYTNGNVCLQITQQINKYITIFGKNNLRNEILKIRNNYKKWVKKFIDIRNFTTAHPIQGGLEATKFILPSSESNNYHNFIMFDVNNNKDENFKLEPYKDLKNLHTYLESLTPIYEKFFNL